MPEIYVAFSKYASGFIITHTEAFIMDVLKLSYSFINSFIPIHANLLLCHSHLDFFAVFMLVIFK